MTQHDKNELKAAQKEGETAYEIKLTLKFLSKDSDLERLTNRTLVLIRSVMSAVSEKLLPIRFDVSKVDL